MRICTRSRGIPAPSWGKEYKSPWAAAPAMMADAGNAGSSPT
ncbi:MAG: hypothetical protein WA130_05800 [Candidatus Methanoperedens sp.]